MGKLKFEQQERKIIQIDKEFKILEDNNKNYNEGIIIIDKPPGPTSHQVSSYVKDILKVKKAGHSGTLDPNVTGVLPIAINSGTKVIQALLNAGKEYVCVMHVHELVNPEKIRQTMKSFIGKIKQLPPVKSAVKRRVRIREIYYIDILEIVEKDVLFRVGCQAGTYIRKLCHDIGEKLGCGAHMSELRRTKAGPFNEYQAINLQELSDLVYEANKNNKPYDFIQPIETAVKHLPKIWIKENAEKTLIHGAQLKVPGIALMTEFKKNEMIAVLNKYNKLVLLANTLMNSNDVLKNKKGLVAKTLRVFEIDEKNTKN